MEDKDKIHFDLVTEVLVASTLRFGMEDKDNIHVDLVTEVLIASTLAAARSP